MRDLVEQFPDLASLVEVGNSTLGQPIVGIQITRGVEYERDLLKPKVTMTIIHIPIYSYH